MMEHYKILVVDDEPDLLDLTSSILRSAGYEVIEATTGNDCLRIAREEYPDLILLDVNLPDINGIDVCKKIKTSPEFVDTFVILISGKHISSDSQVEGLELGADEYIVRPITGKELMARVQAVLRMQKSEKALRKSMERYRLLVETMNEGLGVLNENGFITYVNEKICEMLGYTYDEIIGHHITDFLDEVNQKIFEKQFIERKKGESTPYELVWTGKEGKRTQTIVSPKALFYKEGKFKGSFAVVTDITKLKETEKTLEKCLLQMKLILDSAGEGIYVVDMYGNTLFMNPALLSMTGYKAEDLNGKNLHFILHHSKPDGTPYLQQECPIYNTLKDGVLRNITDDVFWRKDGTNFPVEYTCAPTREGNMITGAVIVVRDIAERIRVFEELKLQKKEAAEAQLIAEVSNKAKSDFLLNMSHELRTPLNAIIGFSEILMKEMIGPVSEMQKDYLKDIFESGKHLLGLINDILDLSEIDIQKVELNLGVINVKELIHKCLEMFQEKITEHFFNVKVEIQDDIGNIVADEKKIKQIIFNLLSNAFKFTPDGGSITVRARRIHDAGFRMHEGEIPPLLKGGEGDYWTVSKSAS
jgi:PAS domain S-box-containing protein